MGLGIKFRPNKPGSPHLNGKVEISKKKDKAEFYATIDVQNDDIHSLLAEWQNYYSWDRPHSAHGGRSPMDRYLDLGADTPFSDEVAEGYNRSDEHMQNANYKADLKLARLKRGL